MTAKPLVIDEVLNNMPDWLSRAHREEFIVTARRAERFVFSEEASGLIGQFCVECGDLILRHRQFALPPFDTMYVEFKRPFFESFINLSGYNKGNLDSEIGYFISGKRLYSMVRSVDAKPAKIMPVYYTIATVDEHLPVDPIERGHIVIFTGGEIGEWNALACAYGSAQIKIDSEDERISLRTQVQAYVMNEYSTLLQKNYGKNNSTNALHGLLEGSAGDVRNIWAALLWLNRPAHTTLSNQPAGRRFFRGKSVAYKSHRTVDIDLHKIRSLRRAFTLSGERLSPRRHRVRGAFHHKHGSFGCSHEWPLMPDDNLHWTCEKCGRVRWWVKDHIRGDATRGWVDHDYSVTTGEETPVKEQGP